MECNETLLNKAEPNGSICTNDSNPDVTWQPTDFNSSFMNVALAIALTLINLATICGNLLVLLAFIIEKRLRQPFNMFILNLAITDFLVAITAMTFDTIDTVLGYWPFGLVMCGVWIYFDFAMRFASVFTMVAISVDRFWCVTHSLHPKSLSNRSRVAILIGIVWVSVFAIWTPPFINDRRKHSVRYTCIWEPSDNTEFVIFIAIVGHYCPCAIMIFCYFRVYRIMKRQMVIVAARLPSIQPVVQFHPEVDASSSFPPSSPGVEHETPSPANIGQASQVNPGLNTCTAVTPGINTRTAVLNTDMDNKPVRTTMDNKPIRTTPFGTINRSPSQFQPERPLNQTHCLILNVCKWDNKKKVLSCSKSQISTRHLRGSSVSNGSISNTSINSTFERKLFITLTYILGCYLICWFPFYIAFDTNAWRPELVSRSLYKVFIWMTFVNSTLNPFIYAYTNKEFRMAFVKALHCICPCGCKIRL